jgi:hypothetical protein
VIELSSWSSEFILLIMSNTSESKCKFPEKGFMSKYTVVGESNQWYMIGFAEIVNPNKIFLTLQEILFFLHKLCDLKEAEQITNIKRDGATVDSFWDLTQKTGIYTMQVPNKNSMVDVVVTAKIRVIK